MKQLYENMELLLSCVRYNKYCWNIYGYLKVVALLLGMLLGYGLQNFAASYVNVTVPQ
jgi:hypothetical protein